MSSRLLGLGRQIECAACPARGQELDGLALKVLHCGEIARSFEAGELPIDFAEQRCPAPESVDGQCRFRLE